MFDIYEFRVISNNINNSYLLGLFEGDGYTWTGTFGITNRNLHILEKASSILSSYGDVRIRKDDRGPYRVCVVSRPLFRIFKQEMKKIKSSLVDDYAYISAFFAGKYDADGSRWRKVFKFKITYGIKKQIDIDKILLEFLGIESSIRPYKNRNAMDLEISSHNAFHFYEMIKRFSIKMSSRDDKVRVV